ncbi:aminopeptidase PepB [Aliidiomarina quisquiliarum]|uniref:aminopeptidase PepB n=1 Tax=Aliidiomarina quisquiliarum TaxID=2938947 RepID=UPI00208FE089|nr:aminopeptidase PepB [Aliidiomarina quisquiliarum]MCO4322611.1 aminopeptidase PepB [Aliidiomarina quisquiliarum]
MSSSVQIHLTQNELPAGVRKNSMVFATAEGYAIAVAGKSETETLRIIQQAGRKLDQIGIENAELVGSDWSQEAQWAFAIGFTDTLNKNKVTYTGEPAEALKAMHETYAWVREIINLPPSEIYPEVLCERVAKELTKVGGKAVSHRMVIGPELLAEKRFGLYTVGRASQHPPVMLELDYNPTGNDKAEVDFVLVGKGITFDTGGYSIKSSEGMVSMKCDMGGAATVSGALLLAMRQGLNKRVKLVLCCAENMIDGSAYKNGDIITYKDGQTVEIVNTDAEGRIVLADGLLRAGELGGKRIIDAATLTGAAQVAVGKEYNALFSVDDSYAQEALSAASSVNENLWRLPLAPWHQFQCPSPFADTANSRPQKGGGTGGASNAAGFLLRFAPNNGAGWLHFDLAAAYHGQANGFFAAGATGTGVRTIATLLNA